MRRVFAVLITLALAVGGARMVQHLDGQAIVQSVLDHVWIFWAVVFAISIISVSVMLSHVYPKKEY